MNISTRLRLAQAISIVLFAIMAAVFAVTSVRLRHEVAQAELTGDIVRAAAGLRYLSLEYLWRHDVRSQLQWSQRHQSMAQLLARVDRGDDAEEALWNTLRQRHQAIGSLFSELQGLQDEVRTAPARSTILLELEERLSGLIMNRVQRMMSDADELARGSRRRILAAQNAAMLAGGALGTLVLVVIMGAMALTIRSVTAPLARLRRATEALDADALEVVLDPGPRDEIGALTRAFQQMVERLRQTTVSRNELMHANQALQREAAEREAAEARVLAQLTRMNLLHQITRSTGERQDLRSIFQVVVRSLEDQLPVDFGTICLCVGDELVVSAVGVRSYALSMALSMGEAAHIPIDQNGLTRCLSGQLVYEPDIAAVPFPFPQRLARAGLASLVLAPLQADRKVFGVLVVARCQPQGFSSTDCEFLHQLSEHVALAANQVNLYTTLQQAYDELRLSQAQVTKQERLQALGQMASGIAHDINNAISPISLYAEALLETETGLSERSRAALQVIERAIDDVAATVARMREFYRQREPHSAPGKVDVNLMIEHVIELTRARWSDMPQQRGIVIDLQADLQPDLPAILGVEGELREALTNLVFNAVDALPGGGVVRLCTRSVGSLDGAAGPQVLVAVADNGCGMDEETQRRCVEPFFTTKGERGTGLGLATVYGMTERHGARLVLESAPQQGTTVKMYFPVAPAQMAVVADTPAPRVAGPLDILIIDDDPTLLASLAHLLALDGHRVTQADGGQEGIDRFRAAHAAGQIYSVVITDLGMPYVDGRQVAEAVKQLAPAVPVVLLTGWGQRLIPDTAAGAVAVDIVLSKPPKAADLRTALAQCTQRLRTG